VDLLHGAERQRPFWVRLVDAAGGTLVDDLECAEHVDTVVLPVPESGAFVLGIRCAGAQAELRWEVRPAEDVT
jgi:hypothetical protein